MYIYIGKNPWKTAVMGVLGLCAFIAIIAVERHFTGKLDQARAQRIRLQQSTVALNPGNAQKAAAWLSKTAPTAQAKTDAGNTEDPKTWLRIWQEKARAANVMLAPPADTLGLGPSLKADPEDMQGLSILLEILFDASIKELSALEVLGPRRYTVSFIVSESQFNAILWTLSHPPSPFVIEAVNLQRCSSTDYTATLLLGD